MPEPTLMFLENPKKEQKYKMFGCRINMNMCTACNQEKSSSIKRYDLMGQNQNQNEKKPTQLAVPRLPPSVDIESTICML